MFLDGKAGALTAKLDRGEPVIGVMMMSGSPELVELLAYVGFDYVFIDQMFTDVDWGALATAVRAARGSDLAVLARVENDPWHGSDGSGASAKAARAIGVGCDGVKVNVFSRAQAQSVIGAASGWHRYLHIVPFETDTFVDYQEGRARGSLVIPSVESERGLQDLPDIIREPGLRVAGVAMTDTTRMLGHDMDYEHPDVWKYVDGIVDLARSHDVDICAGTGYSFRTWDEITGRVRRMYDRGIRMIFLQTPEFLFQVATTDLLRRVRGELGY